MIHNNIELLISEVYFFHGDFKLQNCHKHLVFGKVLWVITAWYHTWWMCQRSLSNATSYINFVFVYLFKHILDEIFSNFFGHGENKNSIRKKECMWVVGNTFWSHIRRKTFSKTTSLTLIPSWYIDYTFSTLFACILQISAEIESKPNLIYQWYIYSSTCTELYLIF